jgi:hypothetical protein
MRIKLLALSLIAMPVQAQQIPPACEQYYAAIEACTKNSIAYYERTNIQLAKSMRAQLKLVEEARAERRTQIKEEGEDSVAERCMKPEFTRRVMDVLNATMVPMMFSQALDEKCVVASQSIQLPR